MTNPPRPGDYDFNPKTRPCAAGKIEVGDVVVEIWEHPVVITRVGRRHNEIHLYCRYVWQELRDPEWKLGTFAATRTVPKAVR